MKNHSGENTDTNTDTNIDANTNTDTDIGEMPQYNAWGVYIHVPFCVSRCFYCDFNTFAGMGGYIDAYFKALGREVGVFFRDVRGGGCDAPYADTVFVGGGTPSSVDPAYITRLLRQIRGMGGYNYRDSYYDFLRNRECTIEVNPGALDRDKLLAYAGAGANRISFGLQSTHDAHLKMLGRIHSYGDFLVNIREARNAGFQNINADLLFGLPGQTLAEWEQTLESVVNLGIRHLSCYSLSLEEGTPLHAAVAGGALPAPDEGADRDMYHFTVSYLRSAGVHQYEISNFAEPGYECRHNLKYWTGGRYIGFGAGAHSYNGRRRFSNVAPIGQYIARIESGTRPIADTTVIDAEEREKEFIILRLRLTDGFRDMDFRSVFGYSFLEKYKTDMAELAAAGLIEIENGQRRVRLTPKGMDFANQVFIRFI